MNTYIKKTFLIFKIILYYNNVLIHHKKNKIKIFIKLIYRIKLKIMKLLKVFLFQFHNQHMNTRFADKKVD